MLVGYVSNERYLALEGVSVDIEGESQSVATVSRASGAIHADVPPGDYQIILNKTGYGAKRVELTLPTAEPYQFRLLTDQLLGYMWPKWVKYGDKAEFRMHSPEPYKVSLWRYGFQKEFIKNWGWYDDHGPRATIQLTPDGDYTQTGIQWNTVGYGLSWHKQYVTAPDRGGLYYIHAETASGKFFSFPWLVSPPEPEADICVLMSTITWNAYNNFGGRSNYVNQAGLPSQPIVHARQDCSRYTHPDSWPYQETGAPLSFDRPELGNFVPRDAQVTDQIEGRIAPCYAPGEWRLLGWLDREQYAYDIYPDVDFHFDRIPLDRYKVVILNTHPEYWSPEMYFRMKEWVYEKGGKLMNMSGCGLLAEVEFIDDHTMLCRREEVWELRKEPPATLFGVEYTHSGFNSGAPFRVVNADHWAYEGTGLKNGDLFGFRNQIERVSRGASSLELDKITENSPKNLEHLARGTNNGDQGADAAMFSTPSGGMVFSCGALGWPLSLLVDEGCSRITRNVLERFLKT
ncbi:MAG: N,N-dimethylformamidase beta subunit family domain-containing protein [Planctomycetaceae bacterium]